MNFFISRQRIEISRWNKMGFHRHVLLHLSNRFCFRFYENYIILYLQFQILSKKSQKFVDIMIEYSIINENNNFEERFFASKEQPTRKKISEMKKCTCDIILQLFFFFFLSVYTRRQNIFRVTQFHLQSFFPRNRIFKHNFPHESVHKSSETYEN